MKKHLKWFIPLVSIIAIPSLLFWYMLSMPSMISLAAIYPQARALPELQQIELDETEHQNGLKIYAYGYSLTLEGYETAEDKSLDRNNIVFYVLEENKGLLMSNPDNGDTLSNALFEDNAFRGYIEAYMGKQPETQFDCLHAYYSASVKDISLFNNRRNEALYNILSFKSGIGNPGYTAIFEFEKEDLRGFILTHGNEVPVVVALIFRQSDPNRQYGISFIRFTLQEALPILSTLTFED